jgi:hypothetical protein
MLVPEIAKQVITYPSRQANFLTPRVTLSSNIFTKRHIWSRISWIPETHYIFVPCKESQNEIVTLLGTDVQEIRRSHEKNIPKCKSYPQHGDTVQARALRDSGANRDIRTVPQVQRPWDKPKPRNSAR